MSSSLSITNDEIVRGVLQVAGMGRDAGNMDAATEADVRTIIRNGLRRVRYPVLKNGAAYQWRWLERYHSISVTALYETGTVEVSGGTVTLTGGTFPTWATDGYMSVDGNIIFIDTRTDDTHLETSHTELEVASGTTYQLLRFRYSLPSDFDEWTGGVIYSNSSDHWILASGDEADFRLRYAVNYNYNNRTTHYAVTALPDGTPTIMFWPVPQPDAFIQGTYLAAIEDLLSADLTASDATVQAAPMYARAIFEAIMSAAEEWNDDSEGIHEKRYDEALTAAIAHDRALAQGYDFSRDLSRNRMLRKFPSSIDFTGAI